MSEQTRTYYTTEYRLPERPGDGWKRDKDTCYVRGTNIAREFSENELNELCRLVDLAQQEHDFAEYRVIKVTEQIEVNYYPPVKATQLRLR